MNASQGQNTPIYKTDSNAAEIWLEIRSQAAWSDPHARWVGVLQVYLIRFVSEIAKRLTDEAQCSRGFIFDVYCMLPPAAVTHRRIWG